MADATGWNLEPLAREILARYQSEFGHHREAPRSELAGLSVTRLELDARGRRVAAGEAVVLVACKRWVSTSRKKDHLGELAFRLKWDDDGTVSLAAMDPGEVGAALDGAQDVVQALVPATAGPDQLTRDFLVPCLGPAG